MRQEIDRRIQEKEEEFENTRWGWKTFITVEIVTNFSTSLKRGIFNLRKNHQRALDSMQASLEAEAKGKAEALRMKKKLEADINELEIALDHANKVWYLQVAS